MTQHDIIGAALNNLKTLTGINTYYTRPEDLNKLDPTANAVDGLITLGAHVQTLPVQVRQELRNIPLNLPAGFKDRHGLIAAAYITPMVKMQLKEMGINWLDAAGNCFIRFEELFLFIEGQKVTPLREKKEGKLWTATGLKYIWAILTDTTLLNQNYRIQAETAGIALGRIGDLTAALHKEGWIQQGIKGWFLDRQQELENKWTELYPRVLKPKLLMGTFRFLRQAPNKLPEKIVAGGETAGAAYTDFLHPEITTIYTWLDKETAMKQLQLLPDPAGKVLLYEAFWKEVHDGTGFAPIKIVYADLVGTGDSRNIETAERLKK